MKTFLIAGAIVATEEDRLTFEDVTPAQVNSFINGLGPSDGIELEINSWGGDVTAAISICNLLKRAAQEGHPTVAHVIGVAASSASCIACACQRLVMDSNSLMCIHLPWTVVQGNQEELAKESEVLSNYTQALISVYKTKFSATDEQIYKWLSDETWILAEAASLFDLDAEIIPTQTERRYAASMKGLSRFKKIPKAIMERLDMKKENEIKQADEVKAEVVEVVAEETTAEPVVEEPKAEVEAKVTDEQTEEVIASAEAERRVRGMQASMAKQINALKKDYESRIEAMVAEHKAQMEDLKTKLDGTHAELDKVNAESLSRAQTIDKLTRELQETASALAKQNDALDELTSSVLTPGANLPLMSEGLAKCKTPAERSAFLAAGKYRKG